MPTTTRITQVGAADPEQRTSPIFDDTQESFLSLDYELESPFCYFNSESFGIGQFVCSGDQLLKCNGRGVWVVVGACERE
jgi:hypothetical protein